MSTTEQLKAAVAPRTGAQPAAPTESNRPRTLLDKISGPNFMKQMAVALPKAMTAERLVRVVTTECRRTPALLNTNPESFLGAILQCAQLGLEPGSALGHCYLLPFGSKANDGRPQCQLIIGYRGMIDLARRSGQIVSICAYTVHQKDHFSWRLGLDPNIEHIPSDDADRGAMTHVYAVAKLKGGGVQFEVLSRAEVEKIRNQSKAGKNGPWVTHFEEMSKKTAVRRLFKYLPVSIEAVRAVEADERADRGEALAPQDFIDAEYADRGIEIPPEYVDADTGEIIEAQ